MGYKLKFKMYNKKTNEIVDYMNCSIAIADSTIQSFDRQGNLEGTAANTHLLPIQYANKDDVDKREIYQGFVIERKAGIPGEEEIIGVVELLKCGWWIVNHKEKKEVQLYSETAIDTIIGNIYQNADLKALVM